MKKIFFLLTLVLALGNTFQAQDNNYQATSKKIEMIAVTNIHAWNKTSANVKRLYLEKDGSINYIECDRNGWTKLERDGTYVIDKDNRIHITWDNGFEEAAGLSYTSGKRGLIEYGGTTYYEVLDTDS